MIHIKCAEIDTSDRHRQKTHTHTIQSIGPIIQLYSHFLDILLMPNNYYAITRIENPINASANGSKHIQM